MSRRALVEIAAAVVLLVAACVGTASGWARSTASGPDTSVDAVTPTIQGDLAARLNDAGFSVRSMTVRRTVTDSAGHVRASGTLLARLQGTKTYLSWKFTALLGYGWHLLDVQSSYQPGPRPKA